MRSLIMLYALLTLSSCTLSAKKSDQSLVSGKISSHPCYDQTQNPPLQYIEKLSAIFENHVELRNPKNQALFNQVSAVLVDPNPIFIAQSSRAEPKPIYLIPYFSQCCTNSFSLSPKEPFDVCIDRVFSGVNPNKNLKALSLSRGILLELNTAGRKDWCRYIEYLWEQS